MTWCNTLGSLMTRNNVFTGNSGIKFQFHNTTENTKLANFFLKTVALTKILPTHQKSRQHQHLLFCCPGHVSSKRPRYFKGLKPCSIIKKHDNSLMNPIILRMRQLSSSGLLWIHKKEVLSSTSFLYALLGSRLWSDFGSKSPLRETNSFPFLQMCLAHQSKKQVVPLDYHPWG